MNAQQGSKNEIEMVHQIILAQSRILANILKGVVSQITTLQSMRHDVAQYYQAVQLVTRGHIPASLIPPVKLEAILNQIRTSLRTKHQQYDVAVNDLTSYCDAAIDMMQINWSQVAVLKIPLTAGPSTTFKVYEIKMVRMPWKLDSELKQKSTKIGKLPDYFALSKNNEFYMEMDQFQLNHCVGHMRYRICDPYMVQISTQQPKCSLSLFRNNPGDINGHCDVEFYESSDSPTEVVPLGNGQVLLATNETHLTVNCDNSHHASWKAVNFAFCTRTVHVVCRVSLIIYPQIWPPVGMCITPK